MTSILHAEVHSIIIYQKGTQVMGNAHNHDLAHVQAIQIVCVNLMDESAALQLSKEVEKGEYAPSAITDNLLLPPLHVERSLLKPECLFALQRTAQMLHVEDAHLRIIKHGLPWSDEGKGTICFVPLHITVGFRYGGMNIVGKVFISSLHALLDVLPENLSNEAWASNLKEIKRPLSLAERQALFEYYMFSYIKGAAPSTDMTIIAIPSKPEAIRSKSPTHLAFSQLAVPYPDTQEKVLTEDKWDSYAFIHHDTPEAVQQRQKILSDPHLIEQLSAFRRTWSDNITKHVSAQESKLFDYKQHYTLLDWIRVVWRNTKTSIYVDK